MSSSKDSFTTMRLLQVAREQTQMHGIVISIVIVIGIATATVIRHSFKHLGDATTLFDSAHWYEVLGARKQFRV
jgi:hypothetical protein